MGIVVKESSGGHTDSMWVNYNFESVHTSSPIGMTIGAFDGVHLGHRALIRWMRENAHAAGLQAVVLTFAPLPRQVLHPDNRGVLSTLDQRVECFKALGVDGVVVLPFNQALITTPAETFVEQLIQHLHMRGLWIGPDFALGRERKGNITFLKNTGAVEGFDVHVFQDVILQEGKPVRSSRIRRALGTGRLEEANNCLGRPYQLRGKVNAGEQRGRNLGFPTANLSTASDVLLPANGVYVCRASLPTGQFGAVTNVGTRPTFNHSARTVEAHLLEFAGDIYGQTVCLDFLNRLRPEVAFKDADSLVAQIRQDTEQAEAWLREHSN